MNAQTPTPPAAAPGQTAGPAGRAGVPSAGTAGPACGTGGALSLERQARIAAGALNLIGFAGSFYLPKLIYLCGLVSLGLIFAGITGVCGITYLLVYLPWNRRRGLHV